MYDFHVHSDYSMDSKYLMEEMVLSAIEKNIKSICFTDHIEFDVTSDNIDIVFRTKDYFKKAKQAKYRYIEHIEVLAGVEIGMQHHLGERYENFLKNKPFDFVILSLHTIEGKDINDNRFTYDKEPINALIQYYDYLYRCIENFNDYDVIGHIDYIDRYFEDFSLIPDFEEYKPYVEKILKKVIENDKGIEINTGGIKHGLDYFHPKVEILKLYKELGGKIISFGSDAHSPDAIGYGYREAEKLLRGLGYSYIYIYKNRKKYPIHIC